MIWAKDRRVTTDDGAQVAYTFLGPPDGRPVALCAGFLCPDTWWRYLAPALAGAGHRVLLFHYRGIASSTTPPSPDAGTYTVPRFAADLRVVVEHEDLAALALVGHSMGVQVMLEAYRQLAGRVRALVALTGAVGSPLRSHDARGELAELLYEPLHRVAALTPPPVLRALWDGGWHVAPLLRLGRTVGAFGPRTRPELVASYIEHAREQDPRVALRVAAAMHAHSAADLLPRVAVPTLVVVGGRDPFCPVADGRHFAATVPGAVLRIAPEGTHGTVLEFPDLVNGWVLDFLAAVDAAQP